MGGVLHTGQKRACDVLASICWAEALVWKAACALRVIGLQIYTNSVKIGLCSPSVGRYLQKRDIVLISTWR